MSDGEPTLQLAKQPAGRRAGDQGADGPQRRQLVQNFKAVLWRLVAGVPGRRLRLKQRLDVDVLQQMRLGFYTSPHRLDSGQKLELACVSPWASRCRTA